MITYTADLQALKRMLEPEYLKKAEKSAIKATQRKVATRISRKVREEFNVTARAVAERLRMTLLKEDTEAYLWYIGSRIGLVNFAAAFKKVRTAKGARQGATVKIKRTSGRVTAAGGFIASGRNSNTQVFQRASKDQRSRLPIRKMTGPAIPQMVAIPEVLEDAALFAETEYPKELSNRIDYYLMQQMSK